MKTHIDTRTIPASRSLTKWREAVCSNLVGVECLTDARAELRGQFSQISHDGFAIARLQAEAHQAVRQTSMLRKSNTDFYMLFLQKSGSMRVKRQGRSFEVKPHDMYFYDGMTEHHLTFGKRFDHLAIRVPRAVVEKQWGALAEIGSFHAAATENVVDQVLTPMIGAALGANHSAALPAVVRSAFELFSARTFDGTTIPHGHSAHAQLTLARVVRKIDMCLDDPQFNVEDIAKDLRMSRRNLDRLLAGCGTSFARLLIKKRLDRSVEMLEQPEAAGISITQTAMAVGFENHSFFSRKFREQFGLSPREFRKTRNRADVRLRTEMRLS